MSELQKIGDSIELQMELSRLLCKALGMGCWHYNDHARSGGDSIHNPIYKNCKECGIRMWTEGQDSNTYNLNPNLFTRSAFLDVFDAVLWTGLFMPKDQTMINMNSIKSPNFQLAVLKKLVGEEKVGEVVQ